MNFIRGNFTYQDKGVNRMKSKVIKSSQIYCETPSIECSCGGGCFGMEAGNTYNWQENEYWCEDCGQIWVFPENVQMVVRFKRRKNEG